MVIVFGCQKNIDQIIPSGNNVDTTSNTETTNYNNSFTISAGSGQDSGEILLDFNTTTTGVLTILDQAGRVKKTKNVGLKIDNFQKWSINGKYQIYLLSNRR